MSKMVYVKGFEDDTLGDGFWNPYVQIFGEDESTFVIYLVSLFEDGEFYVLCVRDGEKSFERIGNDYNIPAGSQLICDFLYDKYGGRYTFKADYDTLDVWDPWPLEYI